LPDDAGGGGGLFGGHLPFRGGVAADAGDGFGDADIVGRHGAAGGTVQIADGSAA
jgi:hypothetical protein